MGVEVAGDTAVTHLPNQKPEGQEPLMVHIGQAQGREWGREFWRRLKTVSTRHVDLLCCFQPLLYYAMK